MSILPIAWLDENDGFPPPEAALREDSDAPGLLAAGADLSGPRLAWQPSLPQRLDGPGRAHAPHPSGK